MNKGEVHLLNKVRMRSTVNGGGVGMDVGLDGLCEADPYFVLSRYFNDPPLWPNSANSAYCDLVLGFGDESVALHIKKAHGSADVLAVICCDDRPLSSLVFRRDGVKGKNLISGPLTSWVLRGFLAQPKADVTVDCLFLNTSLAPNHAMVRLVFRGVQVGDKVCLGLCRPEDATDVF